MMRNLHRNPVIKVKEGLIKGKINETENGLVYYSFKGIPYAQPPIGNLRFKAPLAPKPWEGVYEALEHRSVCPQFDFLFTNPVQGNEDCLFLNVYTKQLDSEVNKPVMVFIHGGGFYSGSGNDDMYGPEYLLKHDVVLVAINYRLEVLGFLCLDTPEVPGNAGMKDQVMALRWVQENISQFGGDPKNVTLFGESAGGASVTYHMLSPMSKGLFHKAIVQSGACICDWALAENPKLKAVRTAKILGLDSQDPQEILEYFQKLPPENFCKMTFKIATENEKRNLVLINFSPVVEKKFGNSPAFLDEAPSDLLLKGKINRVPLIIGYNSNEGLLIYLKMTKKNLDFDSFDLIPEVMRNKLSNEKKVIFSDRIKSFYSNNGGFEFCKFASDVCFNYDAFRFISFYSKYNQPVYLYRFSCDTELNIVKKIIGGDGEKGACHADELFYLFSNVMSQNVSKKNQKLIQNMTQLWTNFARTGNPTPSKDLGVIWKPYSSNCDHYLDIGDRLTMMACDESDRIHFWNGLYRQAGLPHITSSKL